jgi:hypothetical protein
MKQGAANVKQKTNTNKNSSLDHLNFSIKDLKKELIWQMTRKRLI